MNYGDFIELWIKDTLGKESIIRFPSREKMTHLMITNFVSHRQPYLRPFLDLLKSLCKDGKCVYPIDFTNYHEWYKILHIEGITFEKEVRGWADLRDMAIIIINSEFETLVDFSSTIFTKMLIFSNVLFQEGLYANDSVFELVKFFKSEFKKKVDFRNSTFKGDMSFHTTSSQNYTIFTLCDFKGNVSFDHADLPNHTIFNMSSFKRGIEFNNIKLIPNSYLEFRNTSSDDCIQLKNTAITGRVDFDMSSLEAKAIPFKTINLKGSSVLGIMNSIQFSPEPANWETAVILKHEEIKRNNVIEALKYKAKEKKLYLKELCSKPKKSWQEKMEIVSLWMSKISNNHGQDWGQAVLVTIFCFWLAPFTLFYLPTLKIGDIWCLQVWELLSSGQFAKDLLTYFVPLNYSLLECYMVNTNIPLITKSIGTVFYMFGKILVPYGIFEIIQAFRKYNKNPS